MIIRKLEDSTELQSIRSNVVQISGPSGSGKTAMLKKLFENACWLDGNLPDQREFLRNMSAASLPAKLGTHTRLVIDNAQRIGNIEITIEEIAKELPTIQFILCSSFPLNPASVQGSDLSAPTLNIGLLPLSFQELLKHHSLENELQLLDHRIIYGYYPAVVSSPGNEIPLLQALAGQTLIRDILIREKVQKTDSLEMLIQLLALNIGKPVSGFELGKQAGMTNETVEKYLQLLERAYIIFRLEGYAKDLKNELSKSRKFYFYDTGIRNAVINQFGSISLRNDAGVLWENFIIAERRKYLLNNSIPANCYFWRTKDKAQVDYLEEYNGKLAAFQLHLPAGNKLKVPKSFVDAYHPNEIAGINRENFSGWLLGNSVVKPEKTEIVKRNKEFRSADLSMEID